MQPLWTLVEKNQFPSAFDLPEFIGVDVRRKIDNRLADQRPPIGRKHKTISRQHQQDQVQNGATEKGETQGCETQISGLENSFAKRIHGSVVSGFKVITLIMPVSQPA
jgi:hypothetical protein